MSIPPLTVKLALFAHFPIGINIRSYEELSSHDDEIEDELLIKETFSIPIEVLVGLAAVAATRKDYGNRIRDGDALAMEPGVTSSSGENDVESKFNEKENVAMEVEEISQEPVDFQCEVPTKKRRKMNDVWSNKNLRNYQPSSARNIPDYSELCTYLLSIK